MLIIRFVILFLFIASLFFPVFAQESAPPALTNDIPNLQKLREKEIFNKGLDYYKAGMYEQALILFSDILKEDPNHKSARQMLEQILNEQNNEITPEYQIQDTQIEATSQVKVAPASKPVIEVLPPVKPVPEILPPVKVTPASKPFIPVKPAPVDKPLSEVIPLEKQSTVEVELKEVTSKEKKKGEAEKPVLPLVPIIPFLPELADFEFAKALNQKGEYEEAIKILEDLLNKYPQSKITSKINLTLGTSYFKSKQYDKATSTIERIVSGTTTQGLSEELLKDDARYLLAQAYQNKGELNKAKIEYLRLINCLETIIPLPKKLEATSTVTDTQAAEDLGLKTLLTPLPQSKSELDSLAHLELGNIYRDQKRYRDAIIEYQLVVNRYHDFPVAAEALYYIGNIYETIYEIRDYETAVKSYNKLLKNYPQSKWAESAKKRKEYLEKNFL